MRCSKGGPKRRAYSTTSLSQEIRKVSNIQPNPIPKGTEKEQHRNPKHNRRREIIKNRAVVNETETEEQ